MSAVDRAAYSRALNSWLSMMRRCLDPLDRAWKDYGARGIVVCERWYDWRNFLADMGGRPEGLSLDRIDNDGNYEPGNCRWADRFTQARNTRHNRFHDVGGVQMLQCDAAKQLGVDQATVYRRMQAGLPVDQKRLLGKLNAKQAAEIRAEPGTTGKALAQRYNVSHQAISSIRRGLTHRVTLAGDE